MFKGIKNLSFLLLLSSLVSSTAFAASDSEIAGKALQACKKLGGDYSVDREPLIEDGDEIQECAKVRCSISSDGAGSVSVSEVKAEFPNASEVGGVIAGWKRSCKVKKRTSDDEFIVDATGDIDVDVDLDGSASGDWDFFINGNLVSFSKWKKSCVKSNGKIRSKCSKKKRNSYSDYYYDHDGRSSGGGKYVVVRGSDGGTHKCYYTKSWDHCLDGEGSVIISVHGDIDGDCEDCGSRRSRRGGGSSTLSGIAEIAGAVLPPLAQLGSNWLWADAYLGSNQAWAGAAATGFEQCQIMQTNHIQSMYGNGTTDMQGFFSNNELPYENVSTPNCNGYQLSGYAGGMGFMGNGMGGFGSPYMSAGYSPGFMSGMSGPYGMYNPYGSVNGMGGMYPGMGGTNGMGIGINIGAGMGGMYPGMGGGIGIGIGSGMPGMGGMYPGMGSGIGIGIGGGINYGDGIGNGTFPGMGGVMCFTSPCNVGGTYGNTYGGGIYGNTGMYGNPWGGGGSLGMGTVPYGNGAGGYWNGTGGYGQNGYGNYGNIQQSYSLNQQALGMDSYYQQAALQGSYNQSAQNLYGYNSGGYGYNSGGYMGGNYGYSPYSPSNMGLGMSLGFGFGF